jgi:hypothetical protein
MGKCKYCKNDAGFLRRSHKVCKRANKEGTKRVLNLAQNAALSSNELLSFKESLNKITSDSFIDEVSLKFLLISGWENAVEKALDDKMLTVDEEKALLDFCEKFALNQDNLDKNGAYTKMVKASVLRELMDGKFPNKFKVDGQLPFNFQKDESLIWLFQNVPYYEQRTRTSYQGGYSGVSIRVMKGVYYRTGGFRGNPVVTTSLVQIDNGLFGVTNKHIYFSGSIKSFRIPFNKIVSFNPYKDGIGIQRDAVTAKPQIFLTKDGWFTYNLLMNISHVQK